LAANVQLQDVCLALDIVQQKTIQVKVERTISFSSQKFDEKGSQAATHNSAAHIGRTRIASRVHAYTARSPQEKSGTCRQIPD